MIESDGKINVKRGKMGIESEEGKAEMQMKQMLHIAPLNLRVLRFEQHIFFN